MMIGLPFVCCCTEIWSLVTETEGSMFSLSVTSIAGVTSTVGEGLISTKSLSVFVIRVVSLIGDKTLSENKNDNCKSMKDVHFICFSLYEAYYQ